MRRLIVALLVVVLVAYPVVARAFAPPGEIIVLEAGARIAGQVGLRSASGPVVAAVGLNPVVGGVLMTGMMLYSLYQWWQASQTEAQKVESITAGTQAKPDKYQIPVAHATVPTAANGVIGMQDADLFTNPWMNTWFDEHQIIIGYANLQSWVSANVGPSFSLGNSQPGTNTCALMTIRLSRGELICSNGQMYLIQNISEKEDGQYRLQKAAKGYMPDESDPDWGTDEGSPLYDKFLPAGLDGLPIRLVGVDESNVPNSLELAPTAQGVRVKNSWQKTDANNNTEVVTNEVLLEPAGLASQAQYSAPGMIDPAPVPGVDPVTHTGTNSGPSGDPVTFPNDYAREGTLAQSNVKLEQLHADLTNQTDVTDPDARTGDDIQGAFGPLDDALSGLRGWSLPAHTSQCPSGTFTIPNSDHVFSWDGHCTFAADHLGLISSVMMVLWNIGALMIVLKA